MNKKFSISNMSVKAKILMFNVAMVLCMIVIAFAGLFTASTINSERKELYENHAMGQYNMSIAFNCFSNIRVCSRNMVLMLSVPGIQKDLQAQNTKIDNFEKTMNAYFANFEENLPEFKNKAIESKYRDVRDKVEAWMTSNDKDIELLMTEESSKVSQATHNIMVSGQTRAEEAEAALTELVTLITTEADETCDKVSRDLTVMTVTLIVLAIVAVLIAFFYTTLLIKLITVPVKQISDAAKKMAVGDVDVEYQKLAEDDLGELMDSFGEMVAAIKNQASVAQQLATGDMTVQITPRSEKDILGKAMKKLAEDQNRTLSNVKESTMQVTVGSEQVAMASQSLAQGATEQASALEQVTASVDDISKRTKVNASEANRANELVHTVKQTAIAGNQQMKVMKEAMEEINKTSESISKIMKVIDDIAFNTNILALNAAVEAARAGVHGKGFSVVAEEVRTLAGKCGSAAGETSEMIENTIRKIKHGSEVADQAEQSLDAIVKQIDEIVGLIDSIATASNEQATALFQIDQAMGQVSQVVQTNSATSEQCAAASEELSNQAANLKNLMANFKLLGVRGGFNPSADLGFGAGASSNDQIISLDGEFGKY